jgi:alpha-1,2-mannosyltransferase
VGLGPAALAFLAVLVFEPARDTLSFGQINLVLLVLVCSDLRGLTAGRRSGGVGIGLAAAIKLTPAVFIGYLLLSWQSSPTSRCGWPSTPSPTC